MNNGVAILLVENGKEDVSLILRALEEAGVTNQVAVVSDGEAAVSYLSGEGVYGDRTQYPMPGLVLLGLDLPGRGGFEVLKWIRDRRDLSGLSVVVLITSREIKEVSRAYAAGANSFLVKPLDFANLLGLGQGLAQVQADVARRTDRLVEGESVILNPERFS
jgi:CheY-like chemotaxis protein